MAAIGFGAGLALRQRRVVASVFDFTGGALPAGATLVRGSTATRVNAAGTIVTEGANVARFDHDPVMMTPRGLLLEPAATNLLLQSNALDLSPWSGSATVSPVADAAPDGGAACGVSDTAGSVVDRNQSVTVPANAAHAASLFLKAGTSSVASLRLALSGGTGTTPEIVFNLIAGTALSRGTPPASFGIVPSGNGWFACWIGIVDGGGNTQANITLRPAFATSFTTTIDAAATGSVLAWGAQMESGAAPTPSGTTPVATMAQAATRSADVLTLDWGMRGVADGAATMRCVFDDASTQDVAVTIAGGVATVPPLTRARLRRVGLV